MRTLTCTMAVAIVAIVAGLTVGCTTQDDENRLTKEDVTGIQPGDGVGSVFSGTWTLQTKVTETDCHMYDFLDATPLPKPNEEKEEDWIFAQNNGELTRHYDTVGDYYEFRGKVDKGGEFEFGEFGSVTGGVEFVEIVSGTMVAEGTKATLRGTSRQSYSAIALSCSATLTVTGERTVLPQSDDESTD